MSGYGLAGGGMGAYVSCSTEDCDYFDKRQDEGSDENVRCVVIDEAPPIREWF